ncbi:hypothetical protein ACTXT7_014379 [Hymenolepis weldensis]
MAVTSEHVDSVIQENDSHLKSSEEALTHLEEVISHVVSEAIEYADKPPEERTLPALVRKSVTQPRRPNPALAYGQVNMPNNGAQMMGFNQMGAYGFPPVQGQIQCNSRFTMPTGTTVIQQTPQRFMPQYNGIQPNQYHAQNAQLQQQYAQAAQFQLQQQQQYQLHLQQQQHCVKLGAKKDLYFKVVHFLQALDFLSNGL